MATYRRHGYFFREAALLTIAMGVALHLFRILFGDEMALRYVVTPETDRILMVPMTYAAITGILVWRRVKLANKFHRAFFHVWFSYLLVCTVYPAFLTMFWRLRLKN